MSTLRELIVDLATAATEVGTRAETLVKKVAFDIEGGGKERAPVLTGNLKNSVSTTITGSASSGEIRAQIGPTVDYGRYVEEGTSRMSPQPYMGPSFDEHSPKLERGLGDLGEELLS